MAVLSIPLGDGNISSIAYLPCVEKVPYGVKVCGYPCAICFYKNRIYDRSGQYRSDGLAFVLEDDMDYELMRLKQAGKRLKECFNITSELIDRAIGEFRQEEAEREKEKQQFYELEKQCKEAGLSEHDTEIVINAWLEM